MVQGHAGAFIVEALIGLTVDDITGEREKLHTGLLSQEVLKIVPEVALNARNLHGSLHHPCQSEGHLLRELLPVHAGLKAVPKIYVQQLAGVSVQHEV